MFYNFLKQVIECLGAAITKKTAFLPKNGQKMPFFALKRRFFWPEWSVVGPHTLFSGCWTQRKAFCKVLEQIIKGFRAAITKKSIFWPKMAKKANFGLKQCFWGLSGHR